MVNLTLFFNKSSIGWSARLKFKDGTGLSHSMPGKGSGNTVAEATSQFEKWLASEMDIAQRQTNLFDGMQT